MGVSAFSAFTNGPKAIFEEADTGTCRTSINRVPQGL
jgi:hypothetical protein